MKKTKIKILGCGSSLGVPRSDGFWGKCKKNKKNFRTRCSLYIEKGKNKILIDASPDLRFQLLKNNITDLNNILITHQHADATAGIPELRSFYFKYGKKKLRIFANNKTINYLYKTYKYCFQENLGYKPILVSKKIKDKVILGKSKSEKITIKSIQVQHGLIKSSAFIFEKFAYLSDCSKLSKNNMLHLKNLNYLIIDCFRITKHPTHFCLNEALDAIKKLKPSKAILTNLHHELDYNFLLKILPRNVKPAYDGLKLTL